MSNQIYTFQILGGSYTGQNGLTFKQNDMFQTREPLDQKFPNKFLRIAVGQSANLPNADAFETPASAKAAPVVPSADQAEPVTLAPAVQPSARKPKAEKTEEEPPAVVTKIPMPTEVPENATEVTNQFISQENSHGLMIWRMPFGGYAITNSVDRKFISESILQNRASVQKFITSYQPAE